jgi:hypothetical protein
MVPVLDGYPASGNVILERRQVQPSFAWVTGKNLKKGVRHVQEYCS